MMSDDLSRRINAAVYIFGGTPHGDFLVAVRDEIERLRAEVEEQALLNGMGVERELAAEAEIKRLRKTLAKIARIALEDRYRGSLD